MDVIFTRTGQRRYAVAVRPGDEWLVMDPAPGYDTYLPHDLVHFLAEAELGLRLGIFGRLAAGGGRFRGSDRAASRKRVRREARLRAAGHADMARSELTAGQCALIWKIRNRAQNGLPLPNWLEGVDAWADQGGDVERVLRRMDETAPVWKRTVVDGSINLVWPYPPARPPAGKRTEPERHRTGRRLARGRG